MLSKICGYKYQKFKGGVIWIRVEESVHYIYGRFDLILFDK